MKINNNNKQLPRRKAIGTILATTVLGATALPPRWSRPIINAVVLPAHAQSSEKPPVTTTIECGALISPGATLTCGAGLLDTRNYFEIDDSGSCPVLIAVNTDTATGFLIDFKIEANFLLFGAETNTSDVFIIYQFCQTPEPSLSQNFSLTLQSNSSIDYLISGHVERTQTSLIIDDILITKV